MKRVISFAASWAISTLKSFWMGLIDSALAVSERLRSIAVSSFTTWLAKFATLTLSPFERRRSARPISASYEAVRMASTWPSEQMAKLEVRHCADTAPSLVDESVEASAASVVASPMLPAKLAEPEPGSEVELQPASAQIAELRAAKRIVGR